MARKLLCAFVQISIRCGLQDVSHSYVGLFELTATLTEPISGHLPSSQFNRANQWPSSPNQFNSVSQLPSSPQPERWLRALEVINFLKCQPVSPDHLSPQLSWLLFRGLAHSLTVHLHMLSPAAGYLISQAGN